jgi:AcrR family transcriptional regulator
MSSIEDKVILAAVDEGGKHMPPTFSTIRIAERCKVSEFLIYDHFKTKANLLGAAHIFLLGKLAEAAKKAAENSSDFESFFSALVSFEVAHPCWNGFLLNYGLCFPQGEILLENQKASEAFYETNKPLLIPRYCPEGNPEEDRFRFRYFFREVYGFSQMIILKEIDDTPELRSKEAKLLFNGLSELKNPLQKAF